MEKEAKGVKRCFTATDAESSDHKPLQIESELETDVKKQKNYKSKEIEELTKSFVEMTQTMKNLMAFFGSKSEPPGISLKHLLLKMGPPPNTSSKKNKEPPKELETYECCYKTDDVVGYINSIFVHGFDTTLTRDQLESALTTYFQSGGLKVNKVFVPIECLTGVSLGCAFIDVDDNQKALELRGGWVTGRRLYVLKAIEQEEICEFPNFTGCRNCGFYLA